MSDPSFEQRQAQAEQWVGNLFAVVQLHPITCPTCQTRFGLEREDMRFAEQTGETLWCPRGHQLKVINTEGDQT